MTETGKGSSAEVLSREAILDAAEQVLRRHGPAKTTVVDVARALGVSHGSVYRHFRSKAALRDAVTERWLARLTEPLDALLAQGQGKDGAAARLRAWVELLADTKQSMAAEDPELFETFLQLTLEAREVVAAHVDHLADSLARIVADGAETGEFTVDDPIVAGRAVLHATARFHHPALSVEWGDRTTLARELDAVHTVVLGGLLTRP